MDIATGPLSTLLLKLAKLLQNEYNLQRSARKGIQFLHKELEFMHAALRKVGEVPRVQLDEMQRIWARDVRELSYDMEDIVDTFMLDIEGANPPSKKGVKKIFKKMTRKVTKFMARREVAQEINDIKERAKELAEQRQRYKVDDIAPTKKSSVDPRLNALYTEATKIVGIEEAKEEVITMLTGGDDDQKKRIVSITGFGGLGKTTLAKAVHDKIKGNFDCTAFISVSRDPDTKKLLKDILYQLDEKKFEDIHSKMLDEMLLIDKASKFLNNKRYLIVIDDIWANEPWDQVIGHALVENNMRSTVIITTRNIDVAEHVGGCYRLKPLSNGSSEMLFYGRIFGSKDNCPSRFSKVSEKILKKCGGVPLAIVTTASLLANKSENIEVWNKVCQSIGSGLGLIPGMDDMRKILLLSYDDLPSHLKTCLLYLSIFPEDYEIEMYRLIMRWVAEGFVRTEQAGDQSLLEIGESYFNELLNRSLIQPTEMAMDGTPGSCRVHDTMLDLIISLSAEERFISTIFDDRKSQEVRWLSLHNNSTCPTMKMPKLRSLTIFSPAGFIYPTPTLSHNLLLRVLDLKNCKLKDLASLGFLGTLSHLRYLGLSSNSSKTDSVCDQLPVEIGKLRFLQILDLYETSVEEVPSSVITGLGQLMCLLSDGIRLPYGLKEQLTSLEVLSCAKVTSECDAEELGHLTQLRMLGVTVEIPDPDYDGYDYDDYDRIDADNYDKRRSCVESLLKSLGKLTKIEDLYIRQDDCGSLDGSMAEPLGKLRQLSIEEVEFLPTWIRPVSLPFLSCLDIEVKSVRREDIQVLGALPCLVHLKFVMEGDEEEKVEWCPVGPDAFPCAVSCEFKTYRGASVVPCTFPRGAMPRLQHFTFLIRSEDVERGKCTVDDQSLAHLPSLRSVICIIYIDSMSTEGYYEVRKIREKLEHEAAVHPNHPLRIQFE